MKSSIRIISFVVLAFLGIQHLGLAQDSLQMDETFYLEEDKPKFFSLNGYLKELGNLSFGRSFQNLQFDNIIHNRLNSQWNFSNRFNLKLDLRTRMFNGATVKNFEQYGAFLEQDNAWADLSWVPVDRRRVIVHSTIDRAFLTYSRDKWELSLGRQRINWGKTYIWNPNDLFNTYSYLDFDYEERPGTDAIRFQYFLGYASGFELAYAPRGSFDESVLAGLWKFNKWNYDFQVLFGNFNDELAVGFGWAGDLWGIGYKGELGYFVPRGQNQANFLNASLSLDYAFPNSLYLQAEFLWNGNWQDDSNPAILFLEPLPANNLFPGKAVLFTGLTYQLHPLISSSLSSIMAPGENLYIIVPGLSFSLKNNLDLLLTSQILRSKELEQVSPNTYLIFTRLKWSF